MKSVLMRKPNSSEYGIYYFEKRKALEELGYTYIKTVSNPSLQTMERWVADGVAKAVDGCKVEPDGSCEHGFQSWLLHLGII